MNLQRVFSGSSLRRSILCNIALRPVSILLGMMYVPLLMRYLSDEQYGIWITVLSIINWIGFFDLGIGNGLRNYLTENLVNKDYKEAKENISTAFIAITGIISAVFLLAVGVGSMLDWQYIFHTDVNVETPLLVSYLFICINIVVSLYRVVFYSQHRSERVALSEVFVKVANIIGVTILYYFNVDDDPLLCMSIAFGLTGLIVNIGFYVDMCRQGEFFIPSVRCFNKSKLKIIGSMGIKFFVLQICALVMLTTDNLMITNLFGPVEVVPYDTAYKLYGVGNAVFIAIITPMWSKFTEAKLKGDFVWIKEMLRRLEYVWLLFTLGMVISIPFFPFISNLWLGRDLVYGSTLIPMMVIYFSTFMFDSMYGYFMNGLGMLDLQIKMSVISALVNIPLSIFLAKSMELGVSGICAGSWIIFLAMGIYCKKHVLQEVKALSKKTSNVIGL